MPTLVVDPWHWLTEDGHFPVDSPRLYRRMLRIARFIEYGGPVKRNETRETLVECNQRPKRRACVGLMWVVKTDDDAIVAHCPLCRNEEAFIHNWQETEWANGMMDPWRSRSATGTERLIDRSPRAMPFCRQDSRARRTLLGAGRD